MITDINKKSVTKELNKGKLGEYWGQYFRYQTNKELYNLSKAELVKEIEIIKKKPKPFVDSQTVINKILTQLSSKHNFHRQFSESFPDIHREQVLGMQLYTIMLEDNEVWIYHETQPAGHKFPHATYFQEERNPTTASTSYDETSVNM